MWSFVAAILGGSDGKESSCSAGDLGSVPGLGKSPGEGNGYPLQCSCLENSTDREAWQATVYGVAKTERLTHTHSYFIKKIYSIEILKNELG